METAYHVREFAGLAGVTVRALHHDDRPDDGAQLRRGLIRRGRRP
jgi:hypothetical protein